MKIEAKLRPRFGDDATVRIEIWADDIFLVETRLIKKFAEAFVAEIKRLNAWDAEGSRRAEAGMERMGLTKATNDEQA